MNIEIAKATCRKCHRCVEECPSEVFRAGKGEVPEVVAASACIACGHCVDVCSAACITHESFPQGTVHDVRTELLPSPESLRELMRSRRSNRSLTDKPIPQAALDDILSAAYYAPTAENSRKVVVTLIGDSTALQDIEDATMRLFIRLARVLMSPVVRPLTRLLLPNLYKEAPGLERFKRLWLAGQRPCTCGCKALLVFSAPTGYDFGWQDCNLAYQNSSLMAEAHGVSQIYMGLVQTACRLMSAGRVRRLLSLPPGHKPYALMALGMPAFRYTRYTERG